MIMKQCTKCKEEKELIEFSKNKRNKDGFRSECKICQSVVHKIYLINNNIKKKEKQKIWYLNNKDRVFKNNQKNYNIEKSKEYNKQYRIKNGYNRTRINEYNKHRRLTNPLFKLRCNISSNIQLAIKRMGYSKKTKTYQILGCTFEEFKKHLEIQFTKGMNWENQGEWHLDHIYPVSLAKDEEHLIQLNHYTNFQPLWAEDNIRKSNKIIEQQLILI